MSRESLRVDELREKLKELGYLRTGIDRFVLAPARQERSPTRIAAAAGVRVGLLAGALLGPAAAIGLAARLPQLVTSIRDSIVVAIYLGVLFGVACAALACVTALFARIAVRRSDALGIRRARLASTVAGILVSAACLAYLALWWSAVNPGPAWSASLWTAVALAAALSISLLIGHAVAVTTGAVVAREAPAAAAPDTVARPLRLAFLLRAGAIALGAALLVATVKPVDTTESAAPSDFAVVPTGQRVVVVGLDGFDVRFLDAARRTAAFRRLEPVSAVTVTDAADRDPARVWTTIATGVQPERHGVSELELRRVAGVEGAVARSRLGAVFGVASDSLRLTRPAIASGIDRKEKTFWEVAAEKGLSTAVVNWWATWPATGPGIVLSDRAILRLEHGGTLNNEIFPAALYDHLRPVWHELSAEARTLAMTSFETVEPAAVRAALVRSAELDATAVLLAAHSAIAATDLKVVYLPGLDIAQHALAAADPTPGAAALSARASGVARYYVFLEALLGRLVDRESLVVLVMHPGRVSSASAGRIGLTGSVAAAGAHGPAQLVDVAPTVLYALGLPGSRAISGEALTGLFSEAFVRQVPTRTVDTYGRRVATPPSRGGQPLDNEMLERLRSLGYVR